MSRGRPRKTDPDKALETAMKLFWKQGFEGTSMNDIAAATGMAKPGLYATFGDKEAVYAKALELGGTSEGEPNQRGPYFSAYVRDLDKNKLCLFSMAL